MTGCRKETRLPVPFFSSSLTLLFNAYTYVIFILRFLFL